MVGSGVPAFNLWAFAAKVWSYRQLSTNDRQDKRLASSLLSPRCQLGMVLKKIPSQVPSIEWGTNVTKLIYTKYNTNARFFWGRVLRAPCSVLRVQGSGFCSIVIPAKAGIQGPGCKEEVVWIPVFAGMTLLRSTGSRDHPLSYFVLQRDRGPRDDVFLSLTPSPGHYVSTLSPMGERGFRRCVGTSRSAHRARVGAKATPHSCAGGGLRG